MGDLMGDIADQIIGDILDPLFDEDYEEEDEYGSSIKCKFCGKQYHWEKVRGKWRLHTRTGRIHFCKGYKSK